MGRTQNCHESLAGRNFTGNFRHLVGRDLVRVRDRVKDDRKIESTGKIVL